MNVVNLAQAFTQIPDYWHPRIVGEINDSHVKLARLNGEFVWHHHDLEDELFLVTAGTLVIKTHQGNLVIRPGEFVIIPHGVEHCPVAEEEVQVLLLELKSTVNTGSAGGERTAEADWLDGTFPE